MINEIPSPLGNTQDMFGGGAAPVLTGKLVAPSIYPSPLSFMSFVEYSFILYDKEIDYLLKDALDELLGELKAISKISTTEVDRKVLDDADTPIYECVYQVGTDMKNLLAVLMLLDDLRAFGADHFGDVLFSKVYMDHALLRVAPNPEHSYQNKVIERNLLTNFLEDKNNLIQNQLNIVECRNECLEGEVKLLTEKMNVLEERINSIFAFNYHYQQLQKVPQILIEICDAIGEPEIADDLQLHIIQ